MPQRFLKPQIRDSERWNDVSFECQSLYVRLLTTVDDYGRCDGRPSVVGNCFSVWNAKHPDRQIGLQQVAQMLQELAANKLIEWYEVDGKKVIQLTQWSERIREGCKEKWPANVNAKNLQESAATSCVFLPSPPSSPPSPAPPPPNGGVNGNGHSRIPELMLQVETSEKSFSATPAQTRLNRLFKRRNSTPWSEKEEKALKALGTIAEEDFIILERYYTADHPEGHDYRRKDMLTLLNNFNGELDRARKFKPKALF